MAGDIAKLLASLDLDTRPFSKGAGRVSGDLSKMEGGMGRISTRAIALGSAVGVGLERLAEKGISVLFDSLRSGEEGLHQLQNVTAQTEAVITSTGGAAGITAQQVRDLAESIESLTTADDKAIQNAENLLLTFTGIGKDAFPAATKAVVDLGIAMNGGSAVNVDFGKSAIQVGKALNDPVKGITALSRVGVSFSKEQIKRIKQLQKEGDLYGAQKVILAELTKEFGKAGEAAGKSGAAGVARLSDAAQDAQIALATGLAPALEEIRGEIAKGLADPGTQQDLRNLGRFLGEAAKSGLAFAKSIPWDQVGEGLKTAAGFAGKLIGAFAHLPPGVQATIIGLAGLNKLSGGGVIKIGVDLFKEGAKGILGAFFQRGSSPANPMFVTGLAGGGVPGAGGGGISALGKILLVGEAIGLVVAVNQVRDSIVGGIAKQTGEIGAAIDQQVKGSDLAALNQSLAGIDQGIAALIRDPQQLIVAGDSLKQLIAMRGEIVARLDELNAALRPVAPFTERQTDQLNAAANTQKSLLDGLRVVGEGIGVVATNTGDIGDLIDAVGEVGADVDQANKAIVAAIKGSGAIAPDGTRTGPSGLRWKPSDTIQVEDRRGKDSLAKLAATNAALDRIRERAESNAITTKSAIDDVRDESARAKIAAAGNALTIRNATSTGASDIVGAIRTNRPIVNLDVKVSGMNVKVTKTYSNGDMGGGPSGKYQSGENQ